MKVVVTHLSPDQDAVFSVWLVRRFFPGWGSARVKFVPAGETLNHCPPDEDPDIIHVDTGLGKFDHHHTSDQSVSAGVLVFREIKKNGWTKDKQSLSALFRMSEIVRMVDHALERSWPEPTHDRYEFFLESILDGLKSLPVKKPGDARSRRILAFGMTACDGIYAVMKEKVAAESIIQSGRPFDSPWGKGIAMLTGNDSAHRLAERQGYTTVVVKDPKKGNVRVYVHPNAISADLTAAYQGVTRKDPDSDWFLHASKRLLLNGSRANPKMRPTTLTLDRMIELLSR